MEFAITNELSRRINEGIQEAQRNIDREMRYSEQMRNIELIQQSEAHIAKMVAALDAGVLVVA